MTGIETADWPGRVEIMDVAPRDGLQNEPYLLPAEKKLQLIRGLVDAGLRAIEVTSFVHPKAVPSWPTRLRWWQGCPNVATWPTTP